MSKDKSKPAFANLNSGGMTLREYYAGLAMQVLVINNGAYSSKDIAEDAVIYADALIKELEK